MSMENEKTISSREDVDQSAAELKNRVEADMIVNYLRRDPPPTEGEAEWKEKFGPKLNEILDLHLKHSNPNYWKNDSDIYKAMVEVLEEELYEEKKKAA